MPSVEVERNPYSTEAAVQPSEKIFMQGLDYDNLNTVCFYLGTQRNLSTLTMSILSDHPNCMTCVYGPNQIQNEDNQYWKTGSKSDFMRFTGKIYQLAKNTLKKDPRSIVWKEGLRTAVFLRDNKVDIKKLFKDIPKLRFFMPVRDIFDCACSNRGGGKSGYLVSFEQFRDRDKNANGHVSATLEEVIDAVVSEVAFFMNIRERFPDRCYYLTELSSSRKTAMELCEFLRLPADQNWIEMWEAKFNINKKSYKRDSELMDFLYQNIYEKMPNKYVAYELIDMVSGGDPFDLHESWLEKLKNGA